MQLKNEVVLPAAPDKTFALLNDVERIAPCMPGAILEGRTDEDTYRGRVKVKVGPITAAYSGTVRFVEVDEAGNRLVLDASGTDQHGSGNAQAKVQVRVGPHEQGSVLTLDTDLVIRGKVAQFGGGALGDVTQRLMERFAQNLSALLTEGSTATPTTVDSDDGRSEPASPAGSQEDVDTSQLDGLSLVALPLVKRAAPLAAALTAGIMAGALIGKRGPARRSTVVADELVTATLRLGSDSYSVPVRRVISLVNHR